MEGRLAHRVLEGLNGLGEGAEQIKAIAGRRLEEERQSLSALYTAFRTEAVERLQGHSRELSPAVVTIWEELLQLGLESRRATVMMTSTWKEFQLLYPGTKAITKHI